MVIVLVNLVFLYVSWFGIHFDSLRLSEVPPSSYSICINHNFKTYLLSYSWKWEIH